MSTRKVFSASVAALALAVMSVPVVNAQDGAPETGSLPTGGLFGGSLEEGSLSGTSLGDPEGGVGAGSAGEASGGSAQEGSGSPGSLGPLGSEGGSLADIVPESTEICELPGLGGSVAKFYPLFGITGVPTGVIDIVTSALDSFPNLLDLVAGEGAGTALLWQTGSLSEGLCSSIFGGEMVMPPETVYVDPDGQPTTTVTGTPTPGAGSSGSGGSAASDSSETSDVTEADGATDSTSPEGASEGADEGGVDAVPTHSTTVPVP